MADDFLIHAFILVISTANLLFNFYTSQPRSSLWWCNPRGLMALPLFLSSAGISIYFVCYGIYPDLFGLQDKFILVSVNALAISNWAFTLGTYFTLSNPTFRATLPILSLHSIKESSLIRLLFLTILIVTAVSYYGLFDMGFAKLISMHYGADQWNTIDNNPWLRASVLGTPMLSALIAFWGISGKSFKSLPLIILCIVSILPATILGGRKDLIFILISFAFAASLKRGFNSLKPIVIALAAILSFNYLQTLSRDADSLDLANRLSAINSNQKKENELIGQISVALPIVPTITGAMTVFPERQDYTLGQSYLETVAGTALPKIFFGNQSFDSANSNFHKLYYPEVDNFSMDYSMAAEGYQNFGLIGIPLSYFIMGCLMGNLHKLARINPKSLWPLINLVCFIPGMWALRSDSNTFFKMSFYSSILLLILYFIARAQSLTSTRGIRQHWLS